MTVTLKTHGWDLKIAASQGASVLHCRYEGQDILRPYTGNPDDDFEILSTGGFCLVPFSNRIEDGVFDYGGQTAKLGLTHKNIRPHPIHGFGWIAPWDIIETDAQSVTLRHDLPAGDWPWAYRAQQRFSISAAGLRHELSLENLSDMTMPAGIGFHPYFPDRANAILQCEAGGVWHTRQDGIPTRHTGVPEAWDFSQGKAVADTNIDHVFTDANSVAHISWDNAPKSLKIESCGTLPYAVIYTGSDDGSFCYEPVSHMTDAINRRDKGGPTGMIDLPPGETVNVWMHYAIV